MLLADPATATSWARKPRFVPRWPPRELPVADVVIAGGGPAGATLAMLLGRAGLRVELFEAQRFPREKPCGEGIMPAGVAVLERLGLRGRRRRPPLATACATTASA